MAYKSLIMNIELSKLEANKSYNTSKYNGSSILEIPEVPF